MNVQEFESEVRRRLQSDDFGLSEAQIDGIADELVAMRQDTDNFTVYVNQSATMNVPDSREGKDQSNDKNMAEDQVDQERPADQPVADERPEGVDRADDRGENVDA